MHRFLLPSTFYVLFATETRKKEAKASQACIKQQNKHINCGYRSGESIFNIPCAYGVCVCVSVCTSYGYGIAC